MIVVATVAVVVAWSYLWGFQVGLPRDAVPGLPRRAQRSVEPGRGGGHRASPPRASGGGTGRSFRGSTRCPTTPCFPWLRTSGRLGVMVFFVPLLVWLARGMRRQETRAWATTLLISLLGGIAVSLDNFRPFWLFVGVLVAQIQLHDAGRFRAEQNLGMTRLPDQGEWQEWERVPTETTQETISTGTARLRPRVMHVVTSSVTTRLMLGQLGALREAGCDVYLVSNPGPELTRWRCKSGLPECRCQWNGRSRCAGTCAVCGSCGGPSGACSPTW